MNRGRVIFVGAGPGDPKLVTVRGMEALRKADVVVYDRLVHPALLAYTRHDARLIYVGKEAAKHVVPQTEINRLLVQEARRGKVVVRLKGGDPGVFGRVGEEAQACQEAGIPFDMVPGVTSGTAAPMYAGIPLTHRDYHSSVTFLTGHFCKQNAAQGVNWAALAALPSLVIYMGVKNLPYIQKQLLTHGMAPDTPVALVQWGTVARQQTIVGELQDILQRAQDAQLQPPAIIVIGEVVRLRETLNWYETKPLFGTTIACAVEESAPSEFWTAELDACGAEVIPVRLVPRLSTPAAEQLVQNLACYHWLVFADRHQVDFFFHIFKEQRWDVRRLKAQLATLGPEPADALTQRGLVPTCVLPEDLPAEQIRCHLAAPAGQIGFLQSGNRLLRQVGDIAVLSLGDRVWDDTHPSAEWFRTQHVDAFAAADPVHLDGLAALAGDGWQERTLYCLNEKTARRAREMGWKHVIQWASRWEPARRAAAAPHLPLPEYPPEPALPTQSRQYAAAGN